MRGGLRCRSRYKQASRHRCCLSALFFHRRGRAQSRPSVAPLVLVAMAGTSPAMTILTERRSEVMHRARNSA
jgi:hypothetical protein